MRRKSVHILGFKWDIFLGILTVLTSETAMGATTDDESRILLERIFESHEIQSAALANFEFRAQWEETGSGVGGSTLRTSGTIHRVHQGDQCYFTFTSTHDSRNTPMGDGHHEFETRGVRNDEYFATWSVDRSSGVNYTSNDVQNNACPLTQSLYYREQVWRITSQILYQRQFVRRC